MRKIFLLLFLAVATAGLGGCMVTGLTVAPVPCKMVEHDQIKTFYGVDQTWAALGDGGTGPLTLQELPPPQWAVWVGYLYWVITPIQRQLEGGTRDSNVIDLAFLMVEGHEYQSEKRAPIRWIIGNDPLVVAIGTDDEDIRYDGLAGAGISDGINLGGTYHVVAKADLDRTATELVVMRHWPSVWPLEGNGNDSEAGLRHEFEAEHIVRHIKLGTPMTLQAIMHDRPWKHDGYHPPTTKPTAQEEAITAIMRLSGQIEFDTASPEKPVISVDCDNMTNSALKYLKEFHHLKTLTVGDKIIDSGLKQITGLTQLESLNLVGSNITDGGLKYILLPHLQSLSLADTKVTDAGLLQLARMTQLHDLDLWKTKVTEQGVKKLQEALPNCQITTHY